MTEQRKETEKDLHNAKSELEKTKKLNQQKENKISELEQKVKDKEKIINTKEIELQKIRSELEKIQQLNKKQETKASEWAKMFLSVSGNTNFTARKFSLIYFFAWVFSLLSSGCQNYVARIRTIRTLNQKFDTLRASSNLQSNDVNFTENAGNKLIDNNGTEDNISGIFDNLDNFLPKLEDELFNKYVYIYLNMLYLYKHDTNKISQSLNQNHFFNRDKQSLDMLKQKIDSLNNENITNHGKNLMIIDNNDNVEKETFLNGEENEIIGENK